MPPQSDSPDPTGLSALQHDAIRLLASGCTAKYTALVLRLKYAQVRRWIKEDAQFQTELAALLARQATPAPDKRHRPKGKKAPAAKRPRAAAESE